MLPKVEQEQIQFSIPKGACDCHVHVFGPESKYPYSEDRAYTPSDASEEDLAQLHQKIGIERLVIVHPSPYGVDNQRSQDGIAFFHQNARGVAVIEEDTISLQEIASLHQAGFRGARLNLETAGMHEPTAAKEKFIKTARLIQSMGWHVQLYSNVALIVQLKEVILQSDISVVLDHFARIPADLGLNQEGLKDIFELLESGKVWMKMSAPQRISNNPDGQAVTSLARKLIQINPDRLVWGSDWPHSGAHPGVPRVKESIEPFHPIDDGHALNRLAAWAQDSQMIKKILVDNPAILYQF